MNKIIKSIPLFIFSLMLSSQKVFADVIIPGQTRRGCSVSVSVSSPEYCEKLDREIALQDLYANLPYIIGGIIILVIIISIIVLIKIRRKKNAITVVK